MAEINVSGKSGGNGIIGTDAASGEPGQRGTDGVYNFFGGQIAGGGWRGGNGQSGSNGTDGQSGQAGGTFIAEAKDYVSGIKINASGGDGGNGGSGGMGGAGGTGGHGGEIPNARFLLHILIVVMEAMAVMGERVEMGA